MKRYTLSDDEVACISKGLHKLACEDPRFAASRQINALRERLDAQSKKTHEETTETGSCRVCGAGPVKVRHLPIYVVGSEGLSICHDCEMDVVTAIRSRISIASRAHKHFAARRHLEEQARETRRRNDPGPDLATVH
jgi:hypothetical protein